MRERPRPQPIAYGRPSVEKMLGALPVVAGYCRRLDLAGIIGRACPIREDVAILTHGQVIEALVANRLTSPAPLVRVTPVGRVRHQHTPGELADLELRHRCRAHVEDRIRCAKHTGLTNSLQTAQVRRHLCANRTPPFVGVDLSAR
jgi:hypothetical protein